MAAVGGSVVAAFNHFSAAFKRKSRRADIHVDKIEAEHQLDVGQAALIHRIVDQHLLQEEQRLPPDGRRGAGEQENHPRIAGRAHRA